VLLAGCGGIVARRPAKTFDPSAVANQGQAEVNQQCVQGQEEKQDSQRDVQTLGGASMIEQMKQWLEALKKGVDGQTSIEMDEAITSIKEAIREHAMYEVQRLGQEIEQEPVAWMHIMDNTEGIKANGAGIVSITQKRKHPFGKAGIDFSKSYPVTSTPLYTHPPQRTEQNFCPRCGKRTNDIHTCTPPQDNT
jgi:hypothetical protein